MSNFALVSAGTTYSGTNLSLQAGSNNYLGDGVKDNVTNAVYLAPAAAGGNVTLVIDLGQSRNLTEIRIYFETSGNYIFVNYTLEYWNGSSWVNLATVTGNNQVTKIHTFAQITTTKFRFVCTSGASNYLSFQEIQAYDVVPDDTPPSDASNFTGANIARKKIRLNWTNGTDAESNIGGAKIERHTNSSYTALDETININGTETQYDDENVADNTQYWYRVKTKNGAGLFSDNWANAAAPVTTWNAPPTISNAAQLTNAQLNRSYRETIVTAGGNGARTVSVQPGYSLPAWLSLDTPTNPNDLIGNPNALATNELIYLRVTDANGQYTNYTFQLSTVDTETPEDISSLIATKITNGNIQIESSGSTDNSGSVVYENQRSYDNFVSNIVLLASTSEDFNDTASLPGTVERTWKWRQRAKDASNNASNWTVSNTVTTIPPLVAAFNIASSFALGEDVTANRTSTGGSTAAHTYKWRWFGTTEVLSTQANPNLGALAAGNYDLELEETDAYGNVSTVHHAFAVSVDTSPVITTPATLPYARIGYAYTKQLKSIGGDGEKIWSLPTPDEDVSISEAGLLSYPIPSGTEKIVTARVTDEDGDYDEREFTIPVSELAVFDYCLKYPLDYEYTGSARVFIPRSGPQDRQVRIDTPLKRKLEVNVRTFRRSVRAEIISFHAEHWLLKNFLFHDKDGDEYFEAWISSTLKAPKTGFGTSELIFVIEEI